MVGKNILIVDEVDDTRTTLEYAVRELEKDVEAAGQRLGRHREKTRFSIFVLHVGACWRPRHDNAHLMTFHRIRISLRRAIYLRI